MARDTCGARRDGLTCDRAPHVDGDHRGYDEERDAVLFWPTPAAVLAELERLIRVGLAQVDPAARLDAGARLKVDDRRRDRRRPCVICRLLSRRGRFAGARKPSHVGTDGGSLERG